MAVIRLLHPNRLSNTTLSTFWASAETLPDLCRGRVLTGENKLLLLWFIISHIS